MRHSIKGILSVALLTLASACGGDDDPSANGTGGAAGSGGQSGSGGQAGSSGTAGTAGSSGECQNRLNTGPDGVCLKSVSGRVVDASGAPLSGVDISVCGPICFYGESEAAGAFTVTVNEQVVAADYSTLAHGRPDRTSFYFPLPLAAEGDVAVGDLLLLDLPPSGPTLVVKTDKAGAPAQTVTAGDVTLSVDAGVQIKLDVEDVALGASGKQFRALAIPAAQMSAFADSSLGLAALYALTPFEASIVDEASGAPAKARLSFDNAAQLPAGTAVEVLATGSLLFVDWVKPGAFDVVATGQVSSDGARIEMDPGEGIEYLTWVGIRGAQ